MTIEQLPLRAKLRSDFISSSEQKAGANDPTAPSCSPSKHPTEIIEDHEGNRWVLKHHDPASDPKIVYNEVAMSEFYRMCSLRIPPMHVVYEKLEGVFPEKYHCIGAVSRLIECFLSFREFMNRVKGTTQEKIKWLAENGMGGTAALAFFGAEDDFHAKNAGVELKGASYIVTDQAPSEAAKKLIAEGKRVSFVRLETAWVICFCNSSGEYEEQPIIEQSEITRLEALLSKAKSMKQPALRVPFMTEDFLALLDVTGKSGGRTIFNTPVSELEGGALWVDYDKSSYFIVGNLVGGARAADQCTWGEISPSRYAISTHALTHFPYLRPGDTKTVGADPYCWLTTNRRCGNSLAKSAYEDEEVRLFTELDRLFGTTPVHPEREKKNIFRADALRTFLTLSLLPRDSIVAAFQAHIPDDDFLAKLITTFVDRQENHLLPSLISFDDNHRWWSSMSPDVIEDIFLQYQLYNEGLPEAMQQALAINLDAVRERYADICFRVACRDIERAMMAIAKLVRSCSVYNRVSVELSVLFEQLQEEYKRICSLPKRTANDLIAYNEKQQRLTMAVLNSLRPPASSQPASVASFRKTSSAFFSSSQDSLKVDERVAFSCEQIADLATFKKYIVRSGGVFSHLCFFPIKREHDALSIASMALEQEEDAQDSDRVDDDGFFVVPTLDTKVVNADVLAWMMKTQNGSKVMEIFDHEIAGYERAQQAVIAYEKAKTTVSGFWASMPFGSSSTGAATQSAQSSPIEERIKNIRAQKEELSEALTAHEVCQLVQSSVDQVITRDFIQRVSSRFDRSLLIQLVEGESLTESLAEKLNAELSLSLQTVLSRLFSLEQVTKGSFKEQFVKRLLQQFVAEVSSKQAMEQARESAELVEYLRNFHEVDEIVTLKLVDQFVEAMVPSCDIDDHVPQRQRAASAQM